MSQRSLHIHIILSCCPLSPPKGIHEDALLPLPSHVDEEQQVYEMYRVRLPVNHYSERGVILGEVS